MNTRTTTKTMLSLAAAAALALPLAGCGGSPSSAPTSSGSSHTPTTSQPTSTTQSTSADTLGQAIDKAANGNSFIMPKPKMEDFVTKTCAMGKAGNFNKTSLSLLLLGYPKFMAKVNSEGQDTPTDAEYANFDEVWTAGVANACPKQSSALLAVLSGNSSSDVPVDPDSGEDASEAPATSVLAYGKTFTSKTTGNTITMSVPKKIQVSAEAVHSLPTANSRVYEVDVTVHVAKGSAALDMGNLALTATSGDHDAGAVYDGDLGDSADATVLPGNSYTMHAAYDVVPGQSLQIEADLMIGFTTTAIWTGEVN